MKMLFVACVAILLPLWMPAINEATLMALALIFALSPITKALEMDTGNHTSLSKDSHGELPESASTEATDDTPLIDEVKAAGVTDPAFLPSEVPPLPRIIEPNVGLPQVPRPTLSEIPASRYCGAYG
ncbi:hypothetical protein MTO96_051301 [Rhipicephalus appendiculatus]